MRPDAFAFVMATGIVSIAATDHGFVYVSDGLAVVAIVGLVVLMAAAGVSWRGQPPDIADPDVTIGMFTFVAACAVIDSRLTSISAVVWTLGVLAAVAWLVVSALTARNMAARSWKELQERARGAWELGSVGTSGLAIVTVALARDTGSHALLMIGAAIWLVAIAVYVLMTALILARAFAARLDPSGFEPDAWILMGAMAIATLAGDHLHRAGIDDVRAMTIATWCVASLWILPLLYFGLRHIQRAEARRFAAVWWAMVFPLGMYSAASHAMAVETGWPVLSGVSLTFFWIAFAAWLIVAFAGAWRLRVRRHLPSRHGLR
ncbi:MULTISPECIES: tellurite resistance/C4-dicarboxylate transporter family protein [unclassified Mycobacterium]|uniref:tellurite resistance/C4-dicarboxylate transporter family protein n=1 Tax=unclassified Mycobacterium TaxID=2642494 RepID=UPI000B2B8B00|nr:MULTISPECIES: tellurite resistance/C4-dicarboxylate transporter family protein [unclassified Mycobacterium]